MIRQWVVQTPLYVNKGEFCMDAVEIEAPDSLRAAVYAMAKLLSKSDRWVETCTACRCDLFTGLIVTEKVSPIFSYVYHSQDAMATVVVGCCTYEQLCAKYPLFEMSWYRAAIEKIADTCGDSLRFTLGGESITISRIK